MARGRGAGEPPIEDLLGLTGPRVVTPANPDWIDIARAHLSEGGVLALPTETVYGFAASLETPLGVERIIQLKKRAADKPLPWQAASLEDALALGFRFGVGALALARKFWPGALTLVLPRPASCPEWFASGAPKVALRIPDHPAVLALLRACRAPLAVTSANVSGGPESLDAQSVLWAFADSPHLLVLEGGRAPGGRASTVVDAAGDEPVLQREGPVPYADVLEVWHGR